MRGEREDDDTQPESERPISTAPRVRHVLAVAGSRGGVGSSLVAVNLAVYLAQLGRTVALVDADPSGAFLHSMLGVSPEARSGSEDESALDELRPMKTHVPGLLLEPQHYHVGLTQPLRPGRKPRWARDLRHVDADHVILDLGVSTTPASLELFLRADLGLCVTTPEPPSVEGTYRFLRALFQRKLRRALTSDRYKMRLVERALSTLPPLPNPQKVIFALRGYDAALGERAAQELGGLRAQLVVNGVRLKAHGELGPAMRDLSQRYLGVSLDYVGPVEQDDAVWLSVARQRPLLIDSPTTKSARNLERIARRVLALTSRELETPRAAAVTPSEPTLYDVLMTHPAAGDEELRKAYKRQRDIFQPGSLPLSSLLAEAELSVERARVEEAHDTLLDPVKRRAYDLSTFPEQRREPKQPSPELDAALLLEREMLREELSQEISSETRFTGGLLRKVRESQGIELAQIARHTKISRAQLQAIEDEDFAQLPAFVYLRGFVQEVAKFLELDATQVARTYLRRYGKWRAESGQREQT
jgi:flagellar biosynthesis protein FlhG